MSYIILLVLAHPLAIANREREMKRRTRKEKKAARLQVMIKKHARGPVVHTHLGRDGEAG